MLQHLLGLETAGVTRASRLTSGDREQQALTAAITAGHSEVSGDLYIIHRSHYIIDFLSLRLPSFCSSFPQ